MTQRFVTPSVDSTAVFKADIFKGKVLFCTGGGSGICRGMTEAMMRHGAKATIIGRKFDRLQQAAKELSETTGQECLPIRADVRQPNMLKEAVDQTISKFGRIDFVICGAAGNFLAPIAGMSENGFKSVVEIDTIGSFNTIKATLPYVRKSQGAYIHVSVTLHYSGVAYQAHVSAAKAGLDALSAVLAIEEGPNGVRSNVISPGAIGKTEGWDRLSVLRSLDTNTVPLGREGYPSDVANVTVFLFSDAASYITGAVLPVDGGLRFTASAFVDYPEAVLNTGSFGKEAKSKL